MKNFTIHKEPHGNEYLIVPNDKLLSFFIKAYPDGIFELWKFTKDIDAEVAHLVMETNNLPSILLVAMEE